MAELASGGRPLATNAVADDCEPPATRHAAHTAGTATTTTTTTFPLTHGARGSPIAGAGAVLDKSSGETLSAEKDSASIKEEASTIFAASRSSPTSSTLTSQSVRDGGAFTSPQTTSGDQSSRQSSVAVSSPGKTGIQVINSAVAVSSSLKVGTPNSHHHIVTDSWTTKIGTQTCQHDTGNISSTTKTGTPAAHYTVNASSTTKAGTQSTHPTVNTSFSTKTGTSTTHHLQVVTASSANSANASLPRTGSRTLHNGHDPSFSFRCSLLPVRPLLSKVGEVPEDVENDSEASVASSGSTTTTFLLPLPPVPSDMAEAIKRQQKGAGSVRYWKTKHLQSGRSQTMSLKPNGGFQSAMFPVLKPSPLNTSSGGGGGMVVNSNASPGAESRLSKAKERLLRQRGREAMLGDLRRTINNNSNSSSSTSNGQVPQYHTHYMYGHALGAYPPPPPAYRRSVTTLETFLALPLPASLIHHQPPPPPPSLPHHKLTSHSQPNLKLTISKPALNLTQPTLTLTQPPSQALPQANSDPENGPEDLNSTHQGDLSEVNHKDEPGKSTVTELTCLQLADAILGTKATDLSQCYQICQTKIRYVDFLERSATFRALESTSNKNARNEGLSPPPSLRHTTTARHHTWVPSLDLKDLKMDDVTPHDVTSDRKTSEGESGGSGREGRSLTLPSLVPAGTLSHRLPPSTSTAATTNNTKGYFPTPLQDTEMTSPRGPPGFTGKPILKPFNQDSIPVKVPRHYDPFSPRSVYSDITGTPYQGALRVRGATMYPLNSEEGRVENCREASRRSQSSKSRKEAELRKRAVRFSISDQVYVFAPGEPVVP